MKAIVFAAGIGSRLKPFTDSHPKALAPVGQDTALGFVLRRLVAAGADTVVVNVHHFADQVKEWLATHPCGARIVVSDESDELLDTGGAIAKIYRDGLFDDCLAEDEPVVVHNADILTDISIAGLCACAEGVDAAIFADTARRTGRMLLFDDERMLRGWTNTATGAVRPDGINPEDYTPAAFDGVHCIYRHTMAAINSYCGEHLHPFGIMDFYLDNCRSGCAIRRYTPEPPFRWADIGTTERLTRAQELFK